MLQCFKAPLSIETYFKAGNTALSFPVTFPCFSVCRTRGSDYWSPGWIPACLEQAQGTVCPWSHHHLLPGVISNTDICKYFTHSSVFLTGRFMLMTSLKRVSRNQIKSPACLLYALEICEMWTVNLTRKCVAKWSFCNSAQLWCAPHQNWRSCCSSCSRNRQPSTFSMWLTSCSPKPHV